MTERRLPKTAVENLVEDLASKANADLSNLDATGQAKFDAKANVSNTVTTDTVQLITATKNISVGGTITYARPLQILMPTSTESNPTETKVREIAFVASDGAGERYEGSLTHNRLTDGTSYTGLRAGRLVNGAFKEAVIGVRITESGTIYGTASTPPSASVGGEIVTAEWFRQHACAVRTVVSTYINGANWYRVWNDGWIEQGGNFQTTSTSFQTVNLIKPFTSTNYRILLSGYFSAAASATPIVNTAAGTKTASAFQAFFAAGLHTDWYACGY